MVAVAGAVTFTCRSGKLTFGVGVARDEGVKLKSRVGKRAAKNLVTTILKILNR